MVNQRYLLTKLSSNKPRMFALLSLAKSTTWAGV
jgi:hypothetical protein